MQFGLDMSCEFGQYSHPFHIVLPLGDIITDLFISFYLFACLYVKLFYLYLLHMFIGICLAIIYYDEIKLYWLKLNTCGKSEHQERQCRIQYDRRSAVYFQI